MGHAVEYYTVGKRSSIMKVAEEFAFYNTDRGENPTGHYHGNMTIHDNVVCESYMQAYEKINQWDTGFYSDHAVQYKDKRGLKPTKAMENLKAKMDKLQADRDAYIEKHSLKERKSEYIGCKRCGSKLSNKYLRGTKCPLCGEELRADYIIDRIKKYDADYKELQKRYETLETNQKGKCPIKWLVKVEVHC